MQRKCFQYFALAAMFAAALLPQSVAAYTSARNPGFDHGSDELVLQPFVGSKVPDRKQPGLFRTKARYETAAQQLDWARRLEQTGARSNAAKAYDALVRRWPYQPEAALAQQRLAELHELRGKGRKAFDAYHYLIHFYPESVALRTIFERMMQIATDNFADGRHSRALAMFLTIAEAAPKWSGTPQALLKAGELQQRDKQWFDALATFEQIGSSFPEQPEAETAAAAAAHILYRLSHRYREDDSIQRRAQASLNSVLRRYPQHPACERLRAELDELTMRRYERHYQMAVFYDSPRFNSKAALTAYNEFLRRFPYAPQAEEARQRIATLAAGASE